jgi:hypothetical protein
MDSAVPSGTAYTVRWPSAEAPGYYRVVPLGPWVGLTEKKAIYYALYTADHV